jgi:arylsulfatase A-like enzyme
MVDRWFGRLLDTLDEQELWDETVVIVTSDHGHFLGEHGWIGKPSAPDYNTLAQTPLLIWHPESPRMEERVDALTSAVDLHATILDVFDAPSSDTAHSKSLVPLLEGTTTAHRDWALYGWWGSSINVTDGRYTYMHPCDDDAPVYCHSTSQMDPYGWMGPPTAKTDAEAGTFLPYTDTPVWRYAAPPDPAHDRPLLFDVQSDPEQEENLYERDPEQGKRLRQLLVTAMEALQAPTEQYARFNLDRS